MKQKIYFTCLLTVAALLPAATFAAPAGFPDFDSAVVEEKLVVFTATASFAVNDRTMLAPRFGSTATHEQQFTYALSYDGEPYELTSVGFVLPQAEAGTTSYTFGPDARQSFTTVILAPLSFTGADPSKLQATLTKWPLAEVASE